MTASSALQHMTLNSFTEDLDFFFLLLNWDLCVLLDGRGGVAVPSKRRKNVLFRAGI